MLREQPADDDWNEHLRELRPRERPEQTYEITKQDMIREFRFEYAGKPTGEIRKLLEIYFNRNLQFFADVDETDYSLLAGTDFETPEERAAYFYTTHKPQGYFVDFPNPRYVIIKMLIDPCRSKSNDLCCDGSNESVCEDN